ncbi:unnamed protein product [Rotaria sordida]|uniref:Uncharacterized protein n=2 Tax=Rotaria sordida TaxID=392033 RepID=A0A815KCL5_9BILA|nr:unnamed protein product [Rotaria sordida]
MLTSIQTRHMIDRIENEAFISISVKKALCKLYENRIKGSDQQQDERDMTLKLFNELIDAIKNDFCSSEQYERDHQIQDLYNQLKTNLNNWKNKWLKLVIDIQQFEKAFGELVDYLESNFSIMSTIFEHVSKKTNNVEKENEELRKNLQDIKHETDDLKTKLNQLEISEKRRVEKEKIVEKRILIRDLFLMAHKKLHEEINKRPLPKNILSIVYENDIIELSNKYIFLFKIFHDISMEFKISEEKLLKYLQQKKDVNDDFHLNTEIKQYAVSHSTTKDYKLDEFLELQHMHQLDSDSFSIFQTVFSQVCTIINNSSNNRPPAKNPKAFRVGDKVLVLLNDAKLYPARLIRFGLKNEWMIEFDDKIQGKQWISPNRLFFREEF